MPDVRRDDAPGPDSKARAASPAAGGDAALVAAIAAGDQVALADAYAAHAGRVHGVARRLCGRARAEDLTRAVFLGLWTNPQRYDPVHETLRGFLTMEAHGRAVDMLRSDAARTARGPAENMLPTLQQPASDSAALHAAERAQVDKRVSTLPDAERLPIVLAYFGGHTYREVARLLNVPEGTIKSRIRSGLQHLRTELSTELNLA